MLLPPLSLCREHARASGRTVRSPRSAWECPTAGRERMLGTSLLWRPTPSPEPHGSPLFCNHTAHVSFQAFLAPRPVPSLAGWLATSTINVQGLLWEEAHPWAQPLAVQWGRPGSREAPASLPGGLLPRKLLRRRHTAAPEGSLQFALFLLLRKPALPFKPRPVTPQKDTYRLY